MSREELLPAINALKAMMSTRQTLTIDCTGELRTSCKAALAILEGSVTAGDQTFIMEFDGASKGNPGPAGLGVVIYDPTGAIVQAGQGTAGIHQQCCRV